MKPPSEDEKRRVLAALDDWEALGNLQTTLELHLFAHEWNWDDYAQPLFSIIRHPECDRGTALYLFWLSDPVYFFETYADQNEADGRGDYEADYYRLLVDIQHRYLDGFYTRQTIAINPAEIANEALNSDRFKTPLAPIMRQPSGGETWPNWSVYEESF